MKSLFKNSSYVLRLLVLLSLIMLLIEGSGAKGQILPPDVGIVTQLSGEATYWNESYQRTPEKAEAFMKIRRGDYLRYPQEVRFNWSILKMVVRKPGRGQLLLRWVRCRAELKKGEKFPDSQGW